MSTFPHEVQVVAKPHVHGATLLGVLFFFLCVHIATTTVQAKIAHTPTVKVDFDHMHAWLSSYWHLFLVAYLLGVLAAAYHFSYGIWNFCIRWGITVSVTAQATMQRVSAILFVGLTAVGWAALAGFFMSH